MNSADLILFSSAVLFSVNYVILLKSTLNLFMKNNLLLLSMKFSLKELPPERDQLLFQW